MIKAIFFDLNGTLIDICTSESDENIYRTTANFLDYHGVKITPEKLRDEYFYHLHRQKENSPEQFPEFDVIKVFSRIITDHGGKDSVMLAENCASVFRAAGRYQLQLYDGVLPVLRELQKNYRFAAVSDGQKIWALPELASVGAAEFFPEVIVSSDFGFRKPDQRMYQMAMDKLGVKPSEVIFVGNDMLRDIYGAHEAGMKTVFFRSNQGDHNFHGVEADYIIYNFPQLLEAVDFLTKKQ